MQVLRQESATKEEIAVELTTDPATVGQAGAELEQMHLLTRTADESAYVPLNPRVAESTITARLQENIDQLQKTRARIHRDMRQLMPEYAARSSEPQGSSGLRVIADPKAVQQEINAMTARCTEEVWTMQPGGRRRWTFLEETIRRDRDMLDRGLRMRVLYHHAVRTDYAAQKYAETLTAAGGEVRTADELIERMIIFDRSMAFIAMPRTNGDPPGAVVVTEATLTGILTRTYESVWLSAHAMGGPTDETANAAPVSDELRGMLVRLMAEGHKDEVIAKRMGIATRTCRRYISDLFNDLGAVSRFQAGFKVGLGGWEAGDSRKAP